MRLAEHAGGIAAMPAIHSTRLSRTTAGRSASCRTSARLITAISRGQGFQENFPVTPMMADILAMSMLYGLSTTTRSVNTTYGPSWDQRHKRPVLLR